MPMQFHKKPYQNLKHQSVCHFFLLIKIFFLFGWSIYTFFHLICQLFTIICFASAYYMNSPWNCIKTTTTITKKNVLSWTKGILKPFKWSALFFFFASAFCRHSKKAKEKVLTLSHTHCIFCSNFCWKIMKHILMTENKTKLLHHTEQE